jgi:hypothetical protein
MIPSRAPKRDHDEWLVRWMVGWFGSRSGPGLKYLGMGQFAGQAAVNARGVRCRAFQGARPPCIRRLEEVGNAGSPGLSGRPRSTAMRHGMLPSPGTISPKTSRPARREPHIVCGLTASGRKPRRPRFTMPQPEAVKPAGVFARLAPVPPPPPRCAWSPSPASQGRTQVEALTSPGSSPVTTGEGDHAKHGEGGGTCTRPARPGSFTRWRAPPPDRAALRCGPA